MIDAALLLIGIITISYGIIKWMTANNDHFSKRNVPHSKSFLCFGNMIGFYFQKYSPYDFIEMLYKKFPNEKIFGFFDFRSPVYFVRDPEIIRQMAIKDFDHFVDHRLFFDDSFDKVFGNNLFMLRGEKWRDMRSTLTPIFTGSKMKQMFELVAECADDMTKYFIEMASKITEKIIDCETKESFSQYTMNVIATCAFGVKIDSFRDKENEFILIAKKFLNFADPITGLKFLLLKFLPKSITEIFNIELMNPKITKFFRELIFDSMKIREEKGIVRPDMINLLMQVRQGNLEENQEDEREIVDGYATSKDTNTNKRIVKRKWNDDEILAQCVLFFAAGFDSTSTALTFAIYELALNPHIQERLYEEIIETNNQLNGQRINYDNLQKLEYLDMIISETLRLWSPSVFTDRVCVKDYHYDDGIRKFTIPKDIAFFVPLYSIHRNEKYFSNPKEFNPERFNNVNKNNIVPGTFNPFGIGPRSCIGSRFAIMGMKAAIYYLLLNFKFQTNNKTQIPLKFVKSPLTIMFEKGVELKLVLRDTIQSST